MRYAKRPAPSRRPRACCTYWPTHQRQYFYLARIGSWSEADRTGPEFADPDRGEYRLEEVPLSVRALDALSLEPEEVAALLRAAVTGGTDLAALADPAR
ncbi:hypothetical protein OHB25_56980 [Streptomyces mirabilis]|uniref:hypothetical protein n=1 Tax=Streptomyces TaxID=1883 RepID=UPI001F075D57|nr:MULTISPECIES: hypothetical protein [Streptomyces]MCX4617475.1 hypothetical protein [Streptomyces mirabilis]MCX5357151.1 hypothetical protein [Streptomyces mirabilis]